LIREFVSNNTVYFRAPWGEWPEEAASILNHRVNNEVRHVGPIYWDIDTRDWFYWFNKCSAEVCANACLENIAGVGKGIVIMHDCTADNLNARSNNLTFETVKVLIPSLKSLGFSFVGLDEVELI
jgi:peptidoglycan/xylan/chitin deacetylase (PgdA/CDA1 family)